MLHLHGARPDYVAPGKGKSRDAVGLVPPDAEEGVSLGGLHALTSAETIFRVIAVEPRFPNNPSNSGGQELPEKVQEDRKGILTAGIPA